MFDASLQTCVSAVCDMTYSRPLTHPALMDSKVLFCAEYCVNCISHYQLLSTDRVVSSHSPAIPALELRYFMLLKMLLHILIENLHSTEYSLTSTADVDPTAAVDSANFDTKVSAFDCHFAERLAFKYVCTQILTYLKRIPGSVRARLTNTTDLAERCRITASV